MFLCVTLLILSGFIKTVSVAESLKVIVPEDTVVAHVDEDVVMPCSLQKNISAEDMEVSWLKKEMTVHLYEHGADRKDKQAESYRGRTALFKEELKNGNVSLKLSAVQLSDEGFYTCLVVSSSGPQSATLYLKVTYVFAVWKIALICTSLLSAALIVFVAFVNRKKIQRMLTGVKYSVVASKLIFSDNKDELDLREHSKTEEGYRRLIPVIPRYTKARLAGCNFSKELIITLRNALVPDNSLEELEISDNNLQCSRLWILLDGLKKLRTLKITHCKLNKESCDTLQSVLQSENRLKILDLSNNDLQDAGVEELCKGLKSSHCKLETLRLAVCSLQEKSCDLLRSVLQQENSLKELDLSNNDPKDAGVEKLCEGLKSENCKLERLGLAQCKLGGESGEPCTILASVLNTTLKELDLSYNDLKESGVEKLCEGLKSQHCKLETLRLARCKLGGEREGLSTILASVLQLEHTSLKELDLSYNDLQDSGVEKLCDGLKSERCKLETLRLLHCKLSGENGGSCAKLASVLQSGHTSLKLLDLSYNDLRDSGVKELCKELETSHCKLETLRLSMCKLGEVSCVSLASLVNSDQNYLKELDLSNNDLEDSGVKKLCEGLRSEDYKLETLRLSGCMITEEGCSYLYSALKNFSKNIQNQSLKLKELDLRYNHPEARGKKKLSNKTEKLRLDHAGEDRIKSGPKKYACKLTLDPNTAHRLLSLSEGNRKVEGMKEEKSYPDHPERFSYSKQVLCRESLTGRCYWETEWNDGIGGGVDIAVAYKSVGRKGKNNGFGENEKSSSLSCCGRSYGVSHNDISTNIRPSSMPNRVGVYVDCEAGILSFYSVSTDTQPLKHIHTFTTTFTEPVYAGFRVWDSGSSVRLCQID